MGIESDQVVYEYLSRVGDVAQQRQLPSVTRMRLVSELRNEIDRRRAGSTADTPAAVQRILKGLGTPDEIVAAAGTGAGVPQMPTASVPVQRDHEDDLRPKGLRRVVPLPRTRLTKSAPAPDPAPDNSASSPHLASASDLGASVMQPDWWRVENGNGFALGDSVPGFTGGVEIPELLKPPPPKETPKETPKEPEKEAAKAPVPAAAPVIEQAPETPARRRRMVPRLPAGRWSNPLLLIAAALLVAGAVLGNWFALLLGWLIAYASRRLTDAETKAAVIGLPTAAVAAGIVWLWGRNDGRWGTPIAQGHMNDAIAETWPWVVRGAAVASALFLVWRSQRRR
ncbi:hypothetical protein [Streptomyces sp. N50]|uniref:hypothetical protein n=1 Tax=Streptomyces sp. N50 TaxID=3081765 RepID=UPI0029620CB4|nr:hypothetical protein [Streptomyces sp. N50]WOX10504.1 hypothetical protein R2B38_17360 [Streptomyces sp. N50]